MAVISEMHTIDVPPSQTNMNLEEARRLMAYHTWATESLFQAVQKLGRVEYYGRGKTQPGSIHSNLAHIVVVHHYWMSRWKREDPFLRSEDIRSLEDLHTFWNHVQQQTEMYLNDVGSDEVVNQIFHEPDRNGRTFSHSWTESVLQVVLHSSTLRGQIVGHLRKLKKDPGPLDFISYSRSVRTERTEP